MGRSWGFFGFFWLPPDYAKLGGFVTLGISATMSAPAGAGCMRPWLCLFCLCIALASCASSPGEEYEAGMRRQALLDAYLIAHGMAASYATSRHANAVVVAELARLDRRARALASNPATDESSTEAAVAALTNYAARQSSGLQ